MFPIIFALLHKLNLFVIKGLQCNGKPVIACRERSFYQTQITLLTRIEDIVLSYTEYATLRVLEKIQRSKMQRILKLASNIPYWKMRVQSKSVLFRKIKSVVEIQELPIMLREDVQREFSTGQMVNQSVPIERRVFAQTSGSTGEPLSFFLDTILVAGRRACCWRMLRWCKSGKRPLLVRAKGAHHLGPMNFKGVYTFETRGYDDVDAMLSGLYAFTRSLAKRFSTSIILDMFPSYLTRFTQVVQASKLDISHITGLLTGGESLLPDERDYVERTLSRKIRNKYTAMEFLVIGQECGQSPEHSYHINAEYFYIEIVDANGSASPPGQTGRVIVTSLDHEAQLFLRYDTGDLGHLFKDNCPCGRTLPLLLVEGRQAHLITLPSGKTHSQFSIIKHFYRPHIVKHVREFQIVHETPTALTVKIVPYEATNSSIIHVLRDELSRTFDGEVHVTVELAENIPRAKSGKRKGYIKKF